ncbi:hypothetical protein ACFQZK_12420 [Rhodococcus aetherivorans]
MTGSTLLERAGGRSRVRIGAALTAVPLAVALLGPLFTEPGARGPAFTYGDQWLVGTDSEGRDLLAQVLLGGARWCWWPRHPWP